MTSALMGLLIPLGLYGGLFGYPILQVLAIRRMRGGWRRLALIPVLPMVVVIAWSLAGLMMGSNLWPLWLVFIGPPALLYLAVLFYFHARHMRALRGTPRHGC